MERHNILQLSEIVRAKSSDSSEPHVGRLVEPITGFDTGSLGADFRIPSRPEDRLVSVNDPGSVGAEVLRTLASRLKQGQRRHSIKRLLVTSAVPGEGKTLLSANLSLTLAQSRQRVLLIDGDLHSSSLSRWFGIVDEAFDPECCMHGNFQMPILRKAEGRPLWVLPAGRPCEMPGGIWQSPEFASALAKMEADFDWIIFDSPPLVSFGDAGVISTITDAVVLVTRLGVTPKPTLRLALKSLDASKIIATILNGADVPEHKYYQEYYKQMNQAFPRSSRGTDSRPQLLNSK